MNVVTLTGDHSEGFERLEPMRQIKTGKGPADDIGVSPDNFILHT